MNTAFAHPPGMYAAATEESNSAIPKNTLRMYCCRIEAYDMPKDSDAMNDVQWSLLVAMSEGDREMANSLVQLYESLKANIEVLRQNAL